MEGPDDSFQIDDDAIEEAEGGDAMEEDTPAAGEKEAQKAREEMAETVPPAEAPNRLLVEEATNDDNSVVALNSATMEELCVRAGAPSALSPSPARPLSRAGRRKLSRAPSLLLLTGGWVSAAAATSPAVTP